MLRSDYIADNAGYKNDPARDDRGGLGVANDAGSPG